MDDLLASRYKLDLQIFDGKTDAPTTPLAQRYSRRPASPVARFATETQLDLNNRTWTLSYSSTPEFERMIENDRPELVLISGLLLSGALIALIWSLASTRNRALELAGEMTAELRAKQDALKESEERLGLALQGSDLALFDWNVNTNAVRLSERWASMLGDTPHTTATTMTELSRLVHPNDLPLLQQELNAVLTGESAIYEVEHRVRNRGGEWIWILSRARVAERDADGRPLRLTGTNSDVTARKLVEQMKTEFVATVSHELRTPLTVIVGALALLKEELTTPTPDQKMMLAMASENSARLQTLVDDMLDFEKIASGTAVFDVQPVALGPFLVRALDLNRVYADRFKVRYELRGPLPPVALLADPERLMQVMANLLSNAAKFSPENGVVTLAAKVAGDRLRVLVTDRGPGVPAGFRARIFEKFAQADSSDARQKGGTGLGLSISKAIIEKLGGHIGYESEPGAGATFYFELPFTDGAA
jgi:PAS domain S-box-containing protein